MNNYLAHLVKGSYIALLVIIINLCLSGSLYSKIIYKKLDTTISAPLLNQSQMYYLDMNDDGIDEYFFNHGNQMGTLVCEIYSNPPSYTNEILVNNNIPSMLDYSSEVSSYSTEWMNTYNGMSTIALYFQGNWPGATDKYVAVRFKINDEYHYGWLGIEIPSNSIYINIKDCAYDDVPGQMIYAGYKGVEDVNDLINNNNHYAFNDCKLIFSSNTDLPSTLEIYNIFGKIISREYINNNNYNFTELNQGIYIVILNYNNNKIERIVFLK